MSNNFQHRHYAAIAQIIATSATRGELIQRLVELFKQDNPRFDAVRFAKACADKDKH